MDDHDRAANWDRVAAQWSQIGELVRGCRDRAEAHRLLVGKLGFHSDGADQVLDLRITDLVQFARPYEQPIESEAHEQWQVRGRDFTPGEFRREEREPWSQWIRDGVENGWLKVVRLREPGVLRALSRINDDRAIYIEHPRPDDQTIHVDTTIGGDYADGDRTLLAEIIDRIFPDGGAVDDDVIGELWKRPFAGCFVKLDGGKTAARALISHGWWAVAVSVDPITTAYIKGPGDAVPELDLVTVKSFSELDDQTAVKRGPS